VRVIDVATFRGAGASRKRGRRRRGEGAAARTLLVRRRPFLQTLAGQHDLRSVRATPMDAQIRDRLEGDSRIGRMRDEDYYSRVCRSLLGGHPRS
jgi:hypothetical protein